MADEKSSSNTITDLRGHLFDTLKALKDPTNPMEIDRAKAIADVAGKIIDSARVEVQFAKVTGNDQGSGFLLPQLPATPQPGATHGQSGRIVHRLK